MNLLIRADGDANIGSGHVMRCLALAEEVLRRDGKVLLRARSLSSDLAFRCHNIGVEVLEDPGAIGDDDDIEGTVEASREAKADWVALDGYGLSPKMQKALVEADYRVLVVDDGARIGKYTSHLVTDPNPASSPEDYSERASRTRLLMGPRYALVRREFRKVRPEIIRSPQQLNKIVVSLGGAAPSSVLKIILDGVPPNLDRTLVLTTNQPAKEGIAVRAEEQGWNVLNGSDRMSETLASADLLILAGGSTNWEACCLGVPRLLVRLADNQDGIVDYLSKAGVGIDLGRGEELTTNRIRHAIESFQGEPSWLGQMGREAWKIVDGRGARRLYSILRSYQISIRSVTDEDRDRVLRWNNDPVMRGMAYNPEPISPEAHDCWWKKRMGDSNSRLFIGESDGPLGLIWFHIKGEEAIVSVNVAPERRGAGWGAALIRIATEYFQETYHLPVIAAVRHINPASREVFLDAGYDLGPNRVKFPNSWVMVHSKQGESL